MAESKLNFYIGDIIEGKVDGEKCTSVQCLFPLIWFPNRQYSSSSYPEYIARLPFKFALRCDAGYNAKDVKLTFETGNFHVGYLENDYSDKITTPTFLDLGTIGTTNKIVKLYSDFYPDNAIKLYISYTEVKL